MFYLMRRRPPRPTRTDTLFPQPTPFRSLADRGIGYRPWRAPAIPENDYVPNGDLVLKFDREYDAGGARRTYSDGKRQRLEDLIPAMINTLERWAISVKRRREERAEQKRQ